MQGRIRTGFRAALLATGLTLAITPAANADSPTVEPFDPIAGQAVTITPNFPGAHPPGTTYSWDWDGDGTCETAPTASPDPVTRTFAAGSHLFGSCLTSPGWSEYCGGAVFVKDGRPRPAMTIDRFNTAGLFAGGLRLTVRWDAPPPEIRWDVSYTSLQKANDSIPLAVTANTAGNVTTLNVAPIPAGVVPVGEVRMLYIRAFFASDPVRPDNEPIAGRGIDIPAREVTPAPEAAAPAATPAPPAITPAGKHRKSKPARKHRRHKHTRQNKHPGKRKRARTA